MKYNKKRKINVLIWLLFLSILLTSCEKENPRELCGVWVIDKITVEGKPIEGFLSVNSMSFKCNDNSAYFHGTINSKNDYNAKWKVIEDDNQKKLKIESSLRIYNGNFEIVIDKKTNGQLHLLLKSPKTQISAFKIIEDL